MHAAENIGLLLLLLLQVTVELKNDLAITGILHSVDQYLNIKLTNTHVQNETKYPHMVGKMHLS
jgi:small nuclear ribonucleoprotein (snRNP)-like protein